MLARMHHYTFTGDTKQIPSPSNPGTTITVRRIRAKVEIPFHGVEQYQLGGWIEHTDNLTEDAWVADEAIVCEGAEVSGRAYIGHHAIISGRASIKGFARVFSHAQVTDAVQVTGFRRGRKVQATSIYGHAQVRGHVHIQDNATIMGNARVEGRAFIHGHAVIKDNACVRGRAMVGKYSIIEDHAVVEENARVEGHAIVRGAACVRGLSIVLGNTVVEDRIITRGTMLSQLKINVQPSVHKKLGRRRLLTQTQHASGTTLTRYGKHILYADNGIVMLGAAHDKNWYQARSRTPCPAGAPKERPCEEAEDSAL